MHYFPDGSLGFEPLRLHPLHYFSEYEVAGSNYLKKKKSLKQSQHNTWCDSDGENTFSRTGTLIEVPATVKHISGNILIMDINSSNSAEVIWNIMISDYITVSFCGAQCIFPMTLMSIKPHKSPAAGWQKGFAVTGV